MWTKELHRCHMTSLEPSKLEIDGGKFYLRKHFFFFFFCYFSFFLLPTPHKVSLSWETAKHSLALAMCKLSMEPGLADSGTVKIISMSFLGMVIIGTRVIWKESAWIWQHLPCWGLLLSCQSICSPALRRARLLPHPQLLSFGHLFTLDLNSFETVSFPPYISKGNNFSASAGLAAFLSLEDTFRHSVLARRSPVTINSKWNSHGKEQRSDEIWRCWLPPCQSRCCLHKVHSYADSYKRAIQSTLPKANFQGCLVPQSTHHIH